ncbi:MAG TPA: hypothetical protein VND80_10980 [Steroidobacteraceae bacterium]|nr:hypothetical protein [Steroidobacteraceae bacterium]
MNPRCGAALALALALAASAAAGAAQPLAAAAAAVATPAARAAMPPSLFRAMRWRMIGPFRGGRTRALAGVPGRPAVLYAGAVDGGVWKSIDYGRTWRPIFDGEPTQSIGAIAVAPSAPRIVYVATGEGLQRPDLSIGNGIYKSTDAGKTWRHLGLVDGEQIPSLAVDAHDPDRVFAAVLGHPYGPSTERGIFRSLDGGKSWQRVLYRGPDTGGSQVLIDPSNDRTVYAALWQARQAPWEDDNDESGTGGGLYKSVDGGDTWRKIGRGLPPNLVQINVAVAPREPNRLYAVISTTEKTAYQSGAGMGLFRSDDGGEHWRRITTDPRPVMKIGGGDLPMVAVDPDDPDVVYSTSIVTMRSADGGKTWASLRGAPGGDDYQNIWIDPQDPQVILLVGDQGAVVSVDHGRTWSSWYNQPTAQLYHVSVDSHFPYRVCGAQQESGSVCIASRGNDGEITARDWHPVGAIEYGYVAPDPLDPDVVYGAGRNEVSKYHWSTGQVENVTPIPIQGRFRAERTEPLMFSPTNPHVLYYAANVLFETEDGGQTWRIISPDLTRAHPGIPPSVGRLALGHPHAAGERGAIYALAPSFVDGATLWAGTDDGTIWVTRDGGRHWRNVTPPGVGAWNKVTQIAASPFAAGTAYASVSRMRIDDLRPLIYRTRDGGKTWRKITQGLPPDSPVDTVREDPVRRGLLFAGTETGVFVSFDDGDHWQSLQLNLPHTSMRDLAIHGDDLIVATHGRSFWILDDITALRQARPGIARQAAHLFRPARAWRIRRDTNTDTPLPPDEPAAANPPAGAIIDYDLGPQAAAVQVALEIIDSSGRTVRRYSSTDAPRPSVARLAKQLIPSYWVARSRPLPNSPGMHRVVWDLHYTAPLSTIHGYPIAAVPHATPRRPQGPLAPPGRYTVRLRVAGRSYTAPLIVEMDPRVRVTRADLERQFRLSMRLAAMMSRSAAALLQARSVGKQLRALAAHAPPATAARLERLAHKIARLRDGAPGASAGAAAPTLRQVNADVNTLYGDVGRADAPPTAALVAATSALGPRLDRATAQWRAIVAVDLAALDRRLRGTGLRAVRADRRRR